MDALDEEKYFDSVVGASITAIDEDDESVCLHLSDGSIIEFYAEEDGGFGVQIHYDRVM